MRFRTFGKAFSGSEGVKAFEPKNSSSTPDEH